MATIGADDLTLVDLVKRLAPDKSLDKIVEMLDEDQEILMDIPWLEANAVTGHLSTVRAGLPAGAFRKLNAGVGTEKSETIQITEQIGMLETFLQVDERLADLSGDVNAFRAQESRGAIEGLSQTMATTLFYGDTDIDQEKFLGLAPRYDSTSAGNGSNVLLGGGSSNNTSVWLINWRPDKIHGIYSRGSSGGLKHEDLGKERVYDSNNDSYMAHVSHLKWDVGIAVKDWRYAVRIANIDVTALTKNAATGADLVDLMSQALEQVKDLNGSPRFYCTQTVRSFLRRQIKNSNNVLISMDEVAGKRVLAFDGVAVRKTHAISESEATVS